MHYHFLPGTIYYLGNKRVTGISYCIFMRKSFSILLNLSFRFLRSLLFPPEIMEAMKQRGILSMATMSNCLSFTTKLLNICYTSSINLNIYCVCGQVEYEVDINQTHKKDPLQTSVPSAGTSRHLAQQ